MYTIMSNRLALSDGRCQMADVAIYFKEKFFERRILKEEF